MVRINVGDAYQVEFLALFRYFAQRGPGEIFVGFFQAAVHQNVTAAAADQQAISCVGLEDTKFHGLNPSEL